MDQHPTVDKGKAPLINDHPLPMTLEFGDNSTLTSHPPSSLGTHKNPSQTHPQPPYLGTQENPPLTSPQSPSSLENLKNLINSAPPTAVFNALRATDVTSHSTILSSVDLVLVPRDPVSSSHQALVGRIEEALSHNSADDPLDEPSNSEMETDAESDSEMEDDKDLEEEPDDEMTLVQYQREVKLEAFASRDSSRTEIQSKKGRNSP